MQRKLSCCISATDFSHVVVFFCERTESCCSPLPKYIGSGLKIMWPQVKFCRMLAFSQSFEQPEYFYLRDTLYSSSLKVQNHIEVRRPSVCMQKEVFHLLVLFVKVVFLC